MVRSGAVPAHSSVLLFGPLHDGITTNHNINDVVLLIAMAHLFAVVVAAAIRLPAINCDMLITVRLRSIEEIARRVQRVPNFFLRPMS
jgi:hypothetical protein